MKKTNWKIGSQKTSAMMHKLGPPPTIGQRGATGSILQPQGGLSSATGLNSSYCYRLHNLSFVPLGPIGRLLTASLAPAQAATFIEVASGRFR